MTELWPGGMGVALLTLVAYRLHLNYATVGFLYLLLVVLQSLSGNFWSSAIVSILAVGCLDYFFVPPVLTWRTTDPRDTLALAACLLTALVITRLATQARTQKLTALRHRKELEQLFQAAWQLLALEPEAAGAKCVEIYCRLFDFQAVCMFDAGSAKMRLAGASSGGLMERTRNAYLQDRDVDDGASGTILRSLRLAGKSIGSIGFEAASCSPAVVGALSILSTSTLQRARAYDASMKIASDARAETLRSAILDAFAHQFKTPLTAILAAAGGLDEGGNLNLRQLELLEVISSQSSWLGQLTTRILRVARLDHDEVKPRLKATDLSILAAEVVNRHAIPTGRAAAVDLALGPVIVMADPELLALALLPLLDNAFKYSRAGSSVTVTVRAEAGYGEVRVRNEGNLLPPGEEDHLFERYYRGVDANAADPGAGLGLYVARKIVVAHRGTLELEIEPTKPGTAVFSMRLPSPRRKADDVPRAS